MIYIKKQKPDKEILDRIAEIKNSSEWKKADVNDTEAIRQCFDKLPKETIRKNLLQEQHYLCAYCMKRITDNSLETTIEHWYPLSKDKEKALDYSNMLGVCKGGSNVSLNEGQKRKECCDACKGDNEITINPLNANHMCQIKYTSNGKIYTDNIVLDEDINIKLRLNGLFSSDGSFKCDTSTGLVKGRRDAYKQYQSIMKIISRKRNGNITSAAIRKQINAIKDKEKMDEFAGVVIFFLEKKYKSLVSQEK